MGAMIEPSNIPNLNQSLFGSDSALGIAKANNKNTADTISIVPQQIKTTI